ncbi:MAG TPA: BamA/TamA family outer membrane protein [Longimicrobiales bacterium]|nr:BamA/TamA family outer membrane protein [Longimicrobiales bacterium]
MSPRIRISLFFALLAVPLPAVRAAAQASPATAPDACEQGRISYVFIHNNSIFDTSDTSGERRFSWAYRTANALHISTREWVIRRELLFDTGSCYDPWMLEQTERLLRGYSFLSSVDVYGVRQPDGTWHVIVSTRDEWSTRLDLRVGTDDGFGFEGVRIVEDNLLGSGQSLGAFYYERDVTRDYGVAYFAPQLFGTRWDLTSELGRTRAGTLVHQEVGYPFVGEVSRWAGRQSFRREDRLFDYIIEDDPDLRSSHIVLPLREQAFDLAVIRRLGTRGNTALLGAALSYQQLSYPGMIELAPEGDYDLREPAPDSLAAPVRRQRQALDNIRVFGLLGHRNVWWQRRQGLDSMRGQEDVRLGAEAILGVGRSLRSLEPDDDLYTTLVLYTGFELGDALLIGRGRVDARRDLRATGDAPEWEDIYIENEILAYLQTALLPRQTFFARASLVGGWNTRTPFQLTLGGLTGLRGYDRERMPGGRRFVATLEDRFYVGWPFHNVLDVGGTVFADVGRIWSGDTPFGIDSGWRASAGFGLRGSFPEGSRSTYRIDIAWPLDRGTGFSDFRLSLSVGEIRGLNSRAEDGQLLRSRTQNVGGELFTFRN